MIYRKIKKMPLDCWKNTSSHFTFLSVLLHKLIRIHLKIIKKLFAVTNKNFSCALCMALDQ